MSDIKLKGGSETMEGYRCGNGCCSHFSSRGFLTKAEKIEILKEYKESLDNELKGVSERISELKEGN